MNHTPALLEDDALRTFLGPGGRWASECGARVKHRRGELNFTLQRVADLTGSTPQTIARVESGAIVPRDKLRVAIAFALFVEVDRLWPWPSRELVHDRAAAS